MSTDQRAVAEAFTALAETMRRLTADDGCAWHAVQTHQTLVRYLIEESYELVEAIETKAPAVEVKEELADLLYQVLFHAAIAERDGEQYSVIDVADTLNEKLIARHPHVFGDRGYMSVDELNAEWEHLKENASGQSRRVLEGIAETMPTLARAEKVIDRLERAGVTDALNALDAGADANTSAETSTNDNPETNAETTPETSAEVGRAMLRLIRSAHANGINADEALRVALRDLTENVRE